MYVPARREETLREFNVIANVELERFRWRLFNQAVIEEDFAGALDIAAKALDDQAARYEAQMADSERFGIPVSYQDPVSQYLAAIHGRLDIIDRVIGFERLALEELKRPYRPLGIEITTDTGIQTDDDRRVQYNQGVIGATEVHTERLAWAIKHKANHEKYIAILEAVRKRPGILQADLAAAVPGSDIKAVTRMVDQLEATNLVATKKVGSRVAVWATDHPQAPSASERRPQRWFWDVMEDTSDYYQGWLDPADTVADIEKLMRIVDEAARQPGIDEGHRPTPLDFIQTRHWQVTSPALSGGVPVYENAEQLAMAFWDHVDLAKATAIAEQIIREDTETTPNQKKKWRLATPRHTHMERIPFTERFGRQEQGWLLREVPEPTVDSVPVTAFTASSACTDPGKAAEIGVACWLKMLKSKA